MKWIIVVAFFLVFDITEILSDDNIKQQSTIKLFDSKNEKIPLKKTLTVPAGDLSTGATAAATNSKLFKTKKFIKTFLEEHKNLTSEDYDFIKELDKQFIEHGDKIKFKVVKDNSTASSGSGKKRTIDGELGYGYQPNGFFFSKPKYMLYPYSQEDIPPARNIQLGHGQGFNGGGGNRHPFFRNKGIENLHPPPIPSQIYHQPGHVHTSVTIQPSHSFEIKQTETGYESYDPSQQIIGNNFLQHQHHHQQEQILQQQEAGPVIVLKIPGPAKYASHLQSLLQQYLELRAAEYIKELEEQERNAYQLEIQQQQHQQQQQQQQLHHHHQQQTSVTIEPIEEQPRHEHYGIPAQVSPQPFATVEEHHHQQQQVQQQAQYQSTETTVKASYQVQGEQHGPTVYYQPNELQTATTVSGDHNHGEEQVVYESLPQPQAFVYQLPEAHYSHQQQHPQQQQHQQQQQQQQQSHVQHFHQQHHQQQIFQAPNGEHFIYADPAEYEQALKQDTSSSHQNLKTSENYPSDQHTQVIFTHDPRQSQQYSYHQQEYNPPPQIYLQQQHQSQPQQHEFFQQHHQQHQQPQQQQQQQHHEQRHHQHVAEVSESTEGPYVTITQKPKTPYNYHAHRGGPSGSSSSVNPTDLEYHSSSISASTTPMPHKRDAPFSEEQFKKYNRLITRLKKKSNDKSQ